MVDFRKYVLQLLLLSQNRNSVLAISVSFLAAHCLLLEKLIKLRQ